ncbi:MAG: hypothetical protein M3Z13_02500 [Candidatus Dormibacteraeota bacterium]|nr:hypothetical protein [Candidatus Dormibacteraeota bacterium]
MPEIPEIALTDGSLRIDGDVFEFDAVTSVSYVKNIIRATQTTTHVRRRFAIELPGERRQVDLDGARVKSEEKQTAWANLVAISQQAIEPRLREKALARLRAGETVTVGRLELRPGGFAWRGALRQKEFPWSAHGRTIYAVGRIKVIVPGPRGNDRTVVDLGTDVPNAVLLPKLMVACVKEFGQ